MNDLFIMIPAITGVGQDGQIPFETHSIYFMNPHGLFQNFPEIDEKIFEIKDDKMAILELCSSVQEQGGYLGIFN